ncbi:MAG: hypothetical protein RIC56_19885 [Pseudomonadales bacterium]
MNEATGNQCPKCQATNPPGAKFCSSCRESLVSAPAPIQNGGQMLPPQPPPQRPGLAGLMGQSGGKTESTNVSADPGAVFAHLVRYVEGLDGSAIRQQFAPQQLVAKIAYRDFVATGGFVVKVDTQINITPSAPGQTSVAVSSKLDFSSTTTLWIVFGCMMAFVIAINPYMFMQYLFLGVLGAGLGFWLLSARPASRVNEALLENLRSNGATLQAAAPVATPAPQPAPRTVVPPMPPAPAPETPAAANGSAAADDPDEEVFKRIRKLAELKELGAISADDFEAKKTELLSRL